MQFQDLLAGLGGAFQGAGQGLDWVADQKRLQVQQQLQQRQQQTQEEEMKRRAVMEAYQALEAGSAVDPNNDQVKAMMGAGLTFEKDATGRIIKPMGMRDRLAGQQLENAQLEGRMTKEQWERRQQILNDPDFYNRPIGERLQAGFGAGEKFDPTTPEEDLQYSASLAAAQARANASMFAATQPRTTDPAVLDQRREAMIAKARTDAARLARTGLGAYQPPEKLQLLEEKLFQDILASMMAEDGSAPQTAPPQTQGVPVLGGKYKRIQ